jgi:asparagine synthetase B (glutamine-hydrolysing)
VIPAGEHGPRGAFEIATGMLFGSCDVPVPSTRVPAPRAALDALVRRALARPPCIIGFSGGRDSSALLAAAVALSRRERWPEPVAVTLEFDAPGTAEREWQELVARHLRLEHWVRLPIGCELDFVGELAAAGIRRHGLLFPANAHMVVPLVREARGGSVMTGVGGDDTFGGWPWHDLGSLFSRRRAARLGDVRRCVHAISPRRVRAEVVRRRDPLALPWLREEVRREGALRIAMELSRAPRTWAARMLWSARWRPWRAAARSVELLGADHGVAVSSPFLEPLMFAALARAGGRWGWGDRTATMRALFADLLPDPVISRRTKAEFSEPMFGPLTRSFALQWDGRAGLDERLVDADALRREWTSPRPHGLSATALQAAWLASGAAGGLADSSLALEAAGCG